MKLVYTLILALALAILLQGGFYFLKLATRGKRNYQYSLQVFPWLAVFLWIAFVFWSFEYLLSSSAIYPFVVSVLAVTFIAALAWFALRDLISGAVLRSAHSLEPGMEIQWENFSGTITLMGYLSLELQTREGEQLSLPYSRLVGQPIRRPSQRGRGKHQVIKLRVHQSHGAQHIQQLLKKRMLALPWVIAGRDLNIHLVPEQQHYVAEISFLTVQEKMLAKTEELLREYVLQALPED